ncbi:hypothetical protein [Dokdonella ginsengisoli]|uniref:Uncharacterized protein n=1 Tax=Dokdonella ginsengisoli TaxID=363846 RepID=A0ABV9QNH7_9GAMM
MTIHIPTRALRLVRRVACFSVAALAPASFAHTAVPSTGIRAERAATLGALPGGSVLYSQNILQHDGQGEARAIVSMVFPDPDYAAYSGEGADDFYVADASGWTIDQVIANGIVYGTDVPNGTDVDVGPFRIAIYPDAGGQPAAAAACSYDALPHTHGALSGGAWSAFGMALPTPCSLAQGTYWLSIVATPPAPLDIRYTWNWSAVHLGSPVPGHSPMVRNPGGDLYPNCPTWTGLEACVNTSANGLVFQLIGSVVAQAPPPESGIALSVGLAQYDGDPAQCASAGTLQASVGDQINACYTVTNHTPLTLNYHTLADASGGAPLFTNANVPIAPGESYRYNRIFAAAQSTTLDPAWTGHTILPPYVPTASTDAFVDIAASGTLLEPSPLTRQIDQPLPFAFDFYGVAYSSICISDWGLIAFKATPADSCGAAEGGEPLPFAYGFGATVEAALMPWWDFFGTAGSLHVATLGSAPARRFVVQWTDKNHVDAYYADPGDPGRVTFQAILNEDGTFDYRYRTVEFGAQDGVHDFGRSATVGLQAGQSGPSNYQYSWGAPVLSDGLSLHWARGESASFTASQSATLDVGAPQIALGQTTLAASAAAGGSATATLDFRNDGDRDLDWTSGEMSAGARHYPIPPRNRALHPRREAPSGLPLRTATAAAAPPAKAKDVPITPLRYRPPVPAFGMVFSTWFPYELNSYAQLDASFPGALQYLSQSSHSYFAGTFVDYDFSTAYVVDAYFRLLIAIDTNDGSERIIGNVDVPASAGFPTGMRWDPSSGTTYLVAANFGTCSTTLYTVDLASAAVQAVGNIPDAGLIDLAIDPAGNAWSVDICNQNTVVVDLAGAQVDVVGALGIDVTTAAGMDFDASTGTLYFAAVDNGSFDPATGAYESHLYTIDRQSGQATVVNDGYGGFVGPGTYHQGSALIGSQLDALAIAAAPGPCASPDDIAWLSRSPSEGTVQPGSTQAVTLTFDASGLAPGTYTGNACIDSNDPERRQVAVPVTFTVTGDPDLVFGDGFDP